MVGPPGSYFSHPGMRPRMNMSKKANTFQTPIGTRDLLPGESARWEAVVEVFCSSVAYGESGFALVDTPLFEDIGVFSRIGEGFLILVGKKCMSSTTEATGTCTPSRRNCCYMPVLCSTSSSALEGLLQRSYFRYEAPQAEPVSANSTNSELKVLVQMTRILM